MISIPVILLLTGILLFFIGLIQCVSSKTFLPFLFGIEIIINAANLNLISFLNLKPNRLDIEPLILFVVGFAAIESAVGLSIFAWANKRLKLLGSAQMV